MCLLIPAVEANPIDTLQNQFSGYGSNPQIVARTLVRAGTKEALEYWEPETVTAIVNAFVSEKFPTVIALNKIDHTDADANVAKIAKAQPPESIVLCSAISEVFLRKLAKQGYVKYTEGSDDVLTREDLIEMGETQGGGLKEMDEKLHNRIENLKDMVLYRFGSTGVVQVLSKAAELLGLVPVFPVRSINSFGSGSSDDGAVFRDCVLLKKGSSVRDCASKIMGDAPIAYVEGIGGVRVSEDDVIAIGKNDVNLSFRLLNNANGDFTRFCHLRLAGQNETASTVEASIRGKNAQSRSRQMTSQTFLWKSCRTLIVVSCQLISRHDLSVKLSAMEIRLE